MNTLIEVGESVDLDMTQFQKNLGDRRLLAKLGEDHTFAEETLGVFGTPTLVFPERQAIFLRWCRHHHMRSASPSSLNFVI